MIALSIFNTHAQTHTLTNMYVVLRAHQGREAPFLRAWLALPVAGSRTRGGEHYCWEEISLPHQLHSACKGLLLCSSFTASLSYGQMVTAWVTLSPELSETLAQSGKERTEGKEGMVTVQPPNPSIKQLDQTMGQRAQDYLQSWENKSCVPGPPDWKKLASCPMWSQRSLHWQSHFSPRRIIALSCLTHTNVPTPYLLLASQGWGGAVS